jgi:hypothetical protein
VCNLVYHLCVDFVRVQKLTSTFNASGSIRAWAPRCIYHGDSESQFPSPVLISFPALDMALCMSGRPDLIVPVRIEACSLGAAY